MWGIKSIKIFDPKSEYGDIARKFRDFLLLSWKDLRFNPLTPPPNVPRNEWYQTIVGHMAQTFNFWEGAQSFLLRLLWNLSQRMVNPTMLDLLNALEVEKPRYKQKDYIIMATVSSRLEMILYTCRDIVMADSDMLPILSHRHYILQTTGLMSEIESWLLEFLLLWEYMYRIWNPDKRDLTLHIYDECQHRLFSSEKERNIKKISASIISMLVDQVRATNISICALSQEPSSLVNAVLNNSYLKVAFHLGSGVEVRAMKEAMGLTDEQADSLNYMETGEAVARMAGGFMDPFPIRVHEFREAERVDEVDFEEHQKRLKADLYEEAGVDGRGVEGVGWDRSLDGKAQEPEDAGEEWDVLG
ncbi:MAG: ATP-binding protein [Candidatus Marinimicrobia bacterium]|nr:ATP-binding protein [Candidatus Neomarinimicrobiota bacterium]